MFNFEIITLFAMLLCALFALVVIVHVFFDDNNESMDSDTKLKSSIPLKGE